MPSAFDADADDLAPGSIIANRYRLERPIGRGGMGTVWEARDDREGRLVAVKLLRAQGRSRRLLREARAARAVRHPHVVEIFEVLEMDDGRHVLVLELLKGESLAEKLEREGQLAMAEAARIFQQVISAVGAAHARGVVHRDLKPQNIFLSDAPGGPVVKVLDFGIAKQFPLEGEVAHTATESGALVGTACYMAPEQAFGEKDVDHRADVWSLGILVYQCLSGVLPTLGDNVGQVLKVILMRRIWPLTDVNPEIPGDVARIVDRMLERDRDTRLGDLRQVQRVLARYATVEVPAIEAPHGPAPQIPRRSRGWALMVFLVACALAVLVLWRPSAGRAVASIGDRAPSVAAPRARPHAKLAPAPAPTVQERRRSAPAIASAPPVVSNEPFAPVLDNPYRGP